MGVAADHDVHALRILVAVNDFVDLAVEGDELPIAWTQDREVGERQLVVRCGPCERRTAATRAEREQDPGDRQERAADSFCHASSSLFLLWVEYPRHGA